jgi:hypothetical protein
MRGGPAGYAVRSGVLAVALVLAAAGSAVAQTPFEPRSGQPGKDVVWVPTPLPLVEKMLDMAKVTRDDVVMDLGSGDGRNVIAAARRGARSIGVEYNPDMVALSRKAASEAGVAERATFVEGDMFEADVSQATVLALFLLPSNLDRLRDKFFALPAGTRIVLNTFGISGWEADESETISGDCTSWCTALLLIVPAKVGGSWKSSDGTLSFVQAFQKLSGTRSNGSSSSVIVDGRLRGDEIGFTVDGTRYTGRVAGDRIEGTATPDGGAARKWSAERTQ